MPRTATPQDHTRWVIYDTKNLRLYSWVFFPSYKKAKEYFDTLFRDEQRETKPPWVTKKDWERKKNHMRQLVILRVRWHISRHDAIQHDLVETQNDE